MNLEFFILDSYWQFVWPAFIFTFTCCGVLYIKTKKELQKHEKMFLSKYGQLSTERIKTTKGKKITKEALLGSSI